MKIQRCLLEKIPWSITMDFIKDLEKMASSLLNDWGIYHFHLTKRFRADGTAKRSKYQLFACCDDNTMYLVQIYPHNKKKRVFTKTRREAPEFIRGEVRRKILS